MEQNPTDNRVDELLVRWKELQKQGRTLSPEELAGDAPELAGELAYRIASMRSGEAGLSLPLTRGDDRTTDFPTSSIQDIGGPLYPAGGFTAVSRLVEPRFHARGGLGEVLVARQQELDRPVASEAHPPWTDP